MDNIITGRPERMDFEQYKLLRKIQGKTIKRHCKGKIAWLSKLEATPRILQQLTDDGLLDSLGKLLSKGETFVGNTKDLK